MSESEDVKLSLRVVMNKEENKVLFAEVDNCFADVLLSFLTLPLGTIARLLVKHYAEGAPVIGSLSTLYQGNDATVFVKDKTSFLISDDLRIAPNLAGSGIKILNDLGIRDIDGLKERTVVVGFKEILDLFKGSLVSRTPLTDLVLGRSQVVSAAVKFELGASLGQITERAISERVIVKAFIQKATNRVLLVEAEDDFVNFLFSLLTLPLVKVAGLLGGNTSLGSVDNLYSSIANSNCRRYLKDFKPMLPASEYCLKNKIFPLTENYEPALYVHREHWTQICYLTSSVSEEYSVTCRPLLFIGMNEKERGVKVPSTFMVTDDLVVTTSSVMSVFSILTSLKIPLFDVEEQAFEIGSEEALSILKACLTSTSALTNGLKPFMNGQLKKMKQEKDMDGKEGYVKGPSMFMVSDDLVVTPCAAISSLSILNNLNTELADVEELTFEIGRQEALSILKASLISVSALTNGLKPFIERKLKKVKQEE
ncbi:UNVERIFIED_CONTAM: hypothetical protein Sradi_2815900 [Sesamum radiatum]|uniref:Uncharacterized protein n=1 Tax=Sesamum radiatum TaxID=300843 RepID=A0AAW2RV82_SESRA